jgi:hypothetical protein
VVIAFHFSSAVAQPEEGAMSPVTATLEPVKLKTVIGEPVVLILTIENTSNGTVLIDLGVEGLGAFRFQIFSDSGELISVPPRYRSRQLRHSVGTFGLYVSKAIPAGGLYKYKVVLDRWFQTKTPGTYKMRCEVASRRAAYTNAKDLGEYAEIPACETEFRKLPYSEDSVKQACSNYLSDALTYQILRCWLGVDFLAFSKPEIGNSFLLQVVEKGTIHARSRALDYLIERHANKSSQSLVQLYRSGKLSDHAKKTMLKRLRWFETFEEEEPKLSKAAKEALRKIGEGEKPETPEQPQQRDRPSVDQSGSQSSNQSGTETSQQTGKGSATWFVFGTIAVVVVLAGVVLFLLLRRRRANSQ